MAALAEQLLALAKRFDDHCAKQNQTAKSPPTLGDVSAFGAFLPGRRAHSGVSQNLKEEKENAADASCARLDFVRTSVQQEKPAGGESPDRGGEPSPP